MPRYSVRLLVQGVQPEAEGEWQLLASHVTRAVDASGVQEAGALARNRLASELNDRYAAPDLAGLEIRIEGVDEDDDAADSELAWFEELGSAQKAGSAHYVSPWDWQPRPQASPDGTLVARILDPLEFRMTGPVVGKLVVSNGIVEESCGVSLAWSPDSRYLAAPKLFPQWPVHFRVLLIDTATGTTRFAPGRYGPVGLTAYTGDALTIVFHQADAGPFRRVLDLTRVRWV